MLRAPSKPEDWTRFNQYAKRVLRLTFDCRNLDAAFIRAIYAYHPDRVPLLPNLRALTWIEPQTQQDITYYSRMLVGPSLENCDMHICDDGPEVTAFLEYLRNNCPDLRMFTVWSASAGISDALDGNLPYFGHLTTLVVHGEVTTATLKHLGCLPRLRDLRFASPRVVEADAFPFSIPDDHKDGSKCTISPTGCTATTRFAALENLTFLSLPPDSPHFLGAFLRSIVQPYPTLRNVRVEETPLPTYAFCDAVDALSMHRAVERVSISCSWCPLSLNGIEDVPQVTWESLAPLHNLALRELCVYDADVRLGRDPGWVEQIGMAWPQLERLELVAADDLVFDDGDDGAVWDGEKEERCLRLEDLRHFAMHLPHLTHLTVPFRLTCSFSYPLPFSLSQTEPEPMVRAPALEHLGVLPLRDCCPARTRARTRAQSVSDPSSQSQSEPQTPILASDADYDFRKPSEAELQALAAAYLSELFPRAHLDFSFLENHLRSAASDDTGADADVAAQVLEAWQTVERLMGAMQVVRQRAVEWEVGSARMAGLCK